MNELALRMDYVLGLPLSAIDLELVDAFRGYLEGAD